MIQSWVKIQTKKTAWMIEVIKVTTMLIKVVIRQTLVHLLLNQVNQQTNLTLSSTCVINRTQSSCRNWIQLVQMSETRTWATKWVTLIITMMKILAHLAVRTSVIEQYDVPIKARIL